MFRVSVDLIYINIVEKCTAMFTMFMMFRVSVDLVDINIVEKCTAMFTMFRWSV